MATKSKATPAKKPGAALVPQKPNLPTRAADMNDLLLADQGSGQENIGANDLTIPRISILQANSPQVKKSDGAYVKGAEEGDFFDNVTGTVYAKGEEGFKFIPVYYKRENIEWVPKDDGGGFVKSWGADDSILAQCTKDSKNRMMLKNGHEIVTTAAFFAVVMDKNGKNPKQAVISMAKTQLKKARKLNTSISSLMVDRTDGAPGKFNPAMFYSVFHATSVPETKDTFNWMGWSIQRSGDTLTIDEKDANYGRELYLNARQFKATVSAGEVKVAAPTDLGGGAAADSGSPEDGETL
jgi:hypothetical protein